MPVLDFSEIPPAIEPSLDAEAFEKFAKDFFITLYQAKITKSNGRGPDGGADIVIQVGEEKWLVSCKHYTSGKRIPPGKEEDPAGRMKRWGCQKFVAFYSPGPSSGLEQKLRETEGNDPLFKKEIMDSGDIERKMIAASSSAGWLLAIRWFPNSFAKIASSLVLPLTEYSEKHLVKSGSEISLPGVGWVAHFKPGDDAAAHQAGKRLTAIGNESATAKAFSAIFLARIEEFARLLPGAFVKRVSFDNEEITPRILFPSWDLSLVRQMIAAKNRAGIRNLCRVWSFWAIRQAMTVHRYALLRFQFRDNQEVLNLDDSTSLSDLAERIASISFDVTTWLSLSDEALSLSNTASDSQTEERGYFAALLSFCPGGLNWGMSRVQSISWLATVYKEEVGLRQAVYALVEKRLPANDQEYVHGLKKLSHILSFVSTSGDNGLMDELLRQSPSLRCLTGSATEIWKPNGDPRASLGNALCLP